MQLIINIALSTCPYLLISYGFMLIFNSAKFFHIAHAIAFTGAAYLGFFFFIQLGLHFSVAVILAISISVLLIIFLELSTYRSFRQLHVPSWHLLIISLGAYIVLQNIISIIWGDNIQVIRTWTVKSGHFFLGGYITTIQITMIVVTCLIVLTTYFIIIKTDIGKKIQAISSNQKLGQTFGISQNKTIIWSFIIGTFLAAASGLLVAFDRDMSPTIGFDWLLYGIIAMIIGGIGRLRHLILGALLLATLQHLTAYYIGSKWMDAVAFIILIIFLAWKPYGFSGQKLRKAEI